MNEPLEEREALWDKFLKLWPLEQLPVMTLQSYNQAGFDDSYCRWLEKHLEPLGSIWGGSSLKFGIYSRANTEKDPSGQNGVTANARYAWYSRYGHSEDEAFTRVRDLIVATAKAAREGDLDDIESIDLWPILKWKIAFLYQNRQQPSVLPIYLRKYLIAALGGSVLKLHSEIYRELLEQRGSEQLLVFADKVYRQGQEVLQHEQRRAVLLHFASMPDLAARLQKANATLAFCDLVLALHELKLDWWITKAGAIHAGRTEDFRVWQINLALRIDVDTNGVRVCVHYVDGVQWQELEEALVDSLVEEVARNTNGWAKLKRAPYWPDDYDNMSDRLVIPLTDGAIRNGYLNVPKLQRLFPIECLGDADQPAPRLFTLHLPGAGSVQTQVLKQHRRIQKRFNALFAAEQVQAGDQAVLTQLADFEYQLSFRRPSQQIQGAVNSTEEVNRAEIPMSNVPLNQIFFGPPGTGKTYSTINAALEILDPAYLHEHQENRKQLTTRFRQLNEEGRIRFVTFHQSFSYEDFVEGLRASCNDEGHLEYRIVPGVFKHICMDAEEASTSGSNAFEEALDVLKERLESSAMPIEAQTVRGRRFAFEYAGGETFRVFPAQSQDQKMPYRAALTDIHRLYRTGDKSNMHNSSYVQGILQYLRDHCGLPAYVNELPEPHQRPNYVLIIDEINRGNISRIFGELITLIETSKRKGKPEVLSVTLPYSKEPFSIPDNLYLIGTMNTADRSLAGMDIALRRRFVFREMPPRPELLQNVSVQGVNIGQLLRVMNERIEVLLGRDYRLGHANFMQLNNVSPLSALAGVFRNQILPLLQEYFFEDWQRIQWVLNDHRKPVADRFVQSSVQNVMSLFGEISGPVQGGVWQINADAFERVSAYSGVISAAVNSDGVLHAEQEA